MYSKLLRKQWVWRLLSWIIDLCFQIANLLLFLISQPGRRQVSLPSRATRSCGPFGWSLNITHFTRDIITSEASRCWWCQWCFLSKGCLIFHNIKQINSVWIYSTTWWTESQDVKTHFDPESFGKCKFSTCKAASKSPSCLVSRSLSSETSNRACSSARSESRRPANSSKTCVSLFSLDLISSESCKQETKMILALKQDFERSKHFQTILREHI